MRAHVLLLVLACASALLLVLPPNPLLTRCLPAATNPAARVLPAFACLRAEEAHATSFGPYASTTAAALAEHKGSEGRFLSAAHILEEAWAW